MEARSDISTDFPVKLGSFFIPREGGKLCNTQDASSASGTASWSTEYYSARIKWISERRSELNMSQEDADIEASKDLWTALDLDSSGAAIPIGIESSASVSVSCLETMTESERSALYEENLQEMRRLQQANPRMSQFFRIGDDGLVLGKKIAEGAQGEIYDAGNSSFAYLDVESNDDDSQWPMVWKVWKVFKAGYKVSDLQKQWPLEFIRNYLSRLGSDDAEGEDFFCNPIFCARLLEDGRFAFEMARWWGDLRKLLDMRMHRNGNQSPPFMMEGGKHDEKTLTRIIVSIAGAMKGLHGGGTLHRDLKASNVLVLDVRAFDVGPIYKLDIMELDVMELDGIGCLVMDYECSIGVVGTRSWMAPEILLALRNKTLYTTPNLFTTKVDVYSFAMTCYEVLTGLVPFEEVPRCDYRALEEEVIEGRRPILPRDLQPWMVDLMNKCWHKDPLERPSFGEIEVLLLHQLGDLLH